MATKTANINPTGWKFSKVEDSDDPSPASDANNFDR